MKIRYETNIIKTTNLTAKNISENKNLSLSAYFSLLVLLGFCASMGVHRYYWPQYLYLSLLNITISFVGCFTKNI
jgi:hypothetical protein